VTLLPATPASPAAWLIIRDHKAGPDLLVDAETGEIEPTDHRSARKLLKERGEAGPPRWLIAERLLPCLEVSDEDVGHGHGRSRSSGQGHGHGHAPGHDHHHMTPLARLIGLVQVERHDIWIVVLYAIGVGALSLATPLAIEALVTTVALNQVLQQLVILALLLLLCLGLAAILRMMQTHLVEVLQRRVFARVATDLAYRLPRVRIDAYDSEYGPELVNRFFDVLTVQKVGASLLLDGISVILGAFFGLIILAFYHPFLLGFDLVLLLILGFMIFFLGRGAVGTSISESRAKYDLEGELEEIARNPIAYKIPEGSQLALRKTDALTRRYLHHRERHWRILFRQIVFALALQAIATSALLGLGGYLVINEDLNLGQLVAAELIVATILAGFAKLGKHLESWYDLMAAMDKIGHLLDLPLERNDGESHRAAQPAQPASVVAQALTYGYDHHRPILRGLDLQIRPGENVALVGPSGSGKSTFLDLILGLRTPDHGAILLDDHNIRDLDLEYLRRRVTMVRRVEVLQDTILENVRVGRSELSLREIRTALAGVGLLDDVDEFSEGLATRLSTSGTPLSAGQVRRLMIARAIAGNPSLLLIDEGLDGLDVLTRNHVLQTLFDPTAPWTLILVTHEQDVAQHCGRAIALSGGRTDRSVAMGNGHSPKIEDWLKEADEWHLN
jgi:ABC-type bacteriocin/lantibiotic exporter with double-glycine peptidase domain